MSIGEWIGIVVTALSVIGAMLGTAAKLYADLRIVRQTTEDLMREVVSIRDRLHQLPNELRVLGERLARLEGARRPHKEEE